MTQAPLSGVGKIAEPTLQRATGYAIATVLVLATLGEGGAHPVSMLIWHGALVALLATVLMLPQGLVPHRTMARAPLVPFALFLVLFALGSLRAPYVYGAVLVSLELAAAVALAWMAARTGSRGLRLLVTPLQIGAALHGGWAIAQWWSGEAARPAGTFLNPNHLALWLVAVSLLGVGGALVGDQSLDVARRLLLVLPAGVAVLLTGSRGAVLGLVAGGLWLVWVRWRLLSAAGKAAALMAIVTLGTLVGLRWADRAEGFDPYRYHRLKIWNASAGAVAADPWWGTGPGQFSTAAANLSFPDGEGPLRFDRAFSVTHSDLIRLPAELGLPAALAVIATLIVAAGRLARRRRAGMLPRTADGAIAALIAVGVHGLMDNPSVWPAVYLLAAALVGCLLSEDTKPAVPARLMVRVAVVGVVCVVFLIADLGPFMAWRHVNDLSTRSSTDADRALLARAIELNPIHPGYWMRLAEARTVDASGWGLDAYSRAREAAERAIRLHPNEAAYHRGLARVESVGCRTLFRDTACRDRVVTVYGRAEALARHDPFLPIQLSAFLLDVGDPAGARRAAERALTIEPEAVVPRLLLADAFIETRTREGLERAAGLLADARERTRSGEDFTSDAYARLLLRPDAAILERLEAKLIAASEWVEPPDPGQ